MATRIQKFMQLFSVVKQEENTDEPVKTKYEIAQSYRSLSEAEIKPFVDQVSISDKMKQAVENIPKMLEPLTKDLQKKRLDNERLIALAPEIDQAAAILIPSILSPNDMRTNQFNITIKCETEDEGVLADITKMLITVFDDELGLSNKLYHWLYATMFRSGAKPLMIMPSDIIPKINNISTVSLESLSEKLVGSVDRNELQGTIESLVSPPPDGGSFQVNDTTLSKVEQMFNADATLWFTDNICALDLSRQQQENATGQIDDGFISSLEAMSDEESVSRHKIPFINIKEFLTTESESSYPSIMELPYEAVVPIIIEGAPDNHIGYFVLLNEQGIPVSVDASGENNDRNEISQSDQPAGDKRVDNMYKAFYGSSYTSHQKKLSSELKAQVVESVYGNYLDSALNDKLKGLQLNDFSVKMSSDIIQVMFTRLMRKTKTTILFVPSELITYMAFEYNANGTGRSKIDNIKFPLSLKITLLITRLMALIESSINRSTLSVAFDENIANPIETLQSIRKEILKKKQHGISYDPNTIISGALDKGLTVIPNNIPGVENFEISEERNNVTYPQPDDQLMNEINTMYTLSLGVSPNSLNRFKEDDLAISVATSNLHMANQTILSQTVVSSSVTKLMKVFIKYSTKMRADICGILEKTENGETQTNEAITTKRLSNIVNGIKFTLPKPNIAFDKSQFEQIREYLSMIDDILNVVMSDDLTDRDNQDELKQLRSFNKRAMMMDYLSDNSAFGSNFQFDMFEDIPVENIADISQSIMNFKKGISDLKEKFVKSDDDDHGGGYR